MKQQLLRQDIEPNKVVSFSWILMWSLSYIACFFLKRDLVTGIIGNWAFAICPGLGIVMVLALLLRVRSVLFACGVLEVFAGVASWVGFIRWNVPWSVGFDPLAQISMALLDLISAVVLFHYSLTLMKDQQSVQLVVGE